MNPLARFAEDNPVGFWSLVLLGVMVFAGYVLLRAARGTCNGTTMCTATIHVHGCLADWPPAVCDRPEEH